MSYKITILILITLVSCSTTKRAPSSSKVKPWYESSTFLYKRIRTFIKRSEEKPLVTFSELRAKRPILKLGKIPMLFPGIKNSGTYFISKRKDVVEVFNNPKIFSVKLYNRKMTKAMKSSHMLAEDMTKYNQEKIWLRKLMPKSDYSRIQKIISDETKDTIKKSSKKVSSKDYEIDLIKDISRKVPVMLMDRYFGFPGPDLKTMYRWSETSQENFFHNVLNLPKIKKASKKSAKEIKVYAKNLIKKIKRDNRNPNTVLAKMIQYSKRAKHDIKNERIIVNISAMLMAAIETTSAAVAKSIDYILSNEDIYDLMKGAISENDNLKIKKIVLESLRFNPQTGMLLRYTEKDYLLAKGTKRETLVKRGSVIMLGTQSAMFDEEYLSSPSEFKLDREQADYFHFGYGHHKCLGDFISMIQVPVIVKNILSLKNVKKVGELQFKDSPFPTSFKLIYESN